MPTYILLVNWTEQGIRTVKTTTERVERTREAATASGVQITGTWWTQGAYDIVVVFEAPNDEAASTFVLSNAARGNIQTQTMRAYGAEEMQRILQKLP